MSWASRHNLLARAVNRNLGGVPVTWGAVSGVGILEENSQLVMGDQVISIEYALHNLPTAQFGNLIYGDELNVGGVVYQVRDLMRVGDGAFCMASLQRLDPGTAAVGRDPREALMLDDLGDVTISDPQVGDKLIREATQWVNYAEPQSLIDAGTAGVIFVGTAAVGTAQTDASWTITRSQFNAAGTRTSRGRATGVTWTGRASHPYS